MKNNFRKFIPIIILVFVILFGHLTYAEDTNNPPSETDGSQVVQTDPTSGSKAEDVSNEESQSFQEEIIIRNGDSILYDQNLELPDEGIIEVPDDTGVPHNIDKRSVLGLLYSADQTNDSFSISDLNYNSSFDSLYMKCLTPSGGDKLCDDWQYVVNNSYPPVGMDKNILSGNNKIYIYFGPQNKITLSDDSIATNNTLTVTSYKYNYNDNTWIVRTGVTVGLTVPDPNNPWTPNDNINTAVGDNGVATFSNIPAGTYDVGIKEDYYWPTEKLTVTEDTSNTDTSNSSNDDNTTNTTNTNDENISSGSYVSQPINNKRFSTDNALNFLAQNQKPDGSFGSMMYTDWVAMASASSHNSLKTNLINYLKSNPLDSSLLTDNERHAMSIMSLNINPYTDTSINYIKKITDKFDGTQFGDTSLINDDIFALLVLSHAGYDNSNDMIKKDIEYIESVQNEDGSFDSVDMTAAATQALYNYRSMGGVKNTISKALNYLVSQQKSNGGFGNSSSTSWAIQALLIDDSLYKNEIDNAMNYLANNQQGDGGVDSVSLPTDSRIWVTSYAIPAYLRLSWNDILNNFSEPEENVTTNNQDTNNTSDITIDSNLIQKEETQTNTPHINVNPKIALLNETKHIETTKNKENTIIKKTNIKNTKQTPIESSNIVDNRQESLMANALLSNRDISNKQFLSLIHNAISVVISPFVWLWNHLLVLV